MQKYLATTGVSKIWDLNKEILFLGPWCLTDPTNKDLVKNIHYSCASSPWKLTIKIKEAADYCNEIYIKLIPELTKAMNAVHKTSYPSEYWRIIIGPWLLEFIGVLYDRFKRIENVLDRYDSFYTSVVPKTKCAIASLNSYDFMVKLSDDFYNLVLFSVVARFLCPERVIETNYEAELKPNYFKYSAKRKIFNSLTKPFDLFFNGHIVLSDMLHLSYIDIARLRWKLGMFKSHFINFRSFDGDYKYDYSEDLRDSIQLKGAADKFQTLLYKVIPYAMSVSCIENYEIYSENTDKYRSVKSAKAIGSAVGWHYSEGLKYFAAKAVANGAKLAEFQHGGGHGLFLSVPHETISLEKDVFYSWGWSVNNCSKVKPLPSPHLSRLKDSHSQESNDILFISGFNLRYTLRFHTQDFPEDIEKYFNDKELFFRELPDNIKNNIYYRPYPNDFGWNEMEQAKSMCHGVRFSLTGNLVELMQKAKMVVVDYPSTSFIEALVINIPCVFFWDHDVNLMRSEVDERMELLRNAGILFKTPAGAAKHIIKIMDNIQDWWGGKVVREARAMFCDKHGLGKGGWMNVWAKELKKYA